MTNNSFERMPIRRNTALGLLAWTLIIVLSLAWGISSTRKQSFELATQQAVAYITKDIAFRNWATSHGGVYVPPTDKTPPNPYLAHIKDRDVTTTSGKSLTLMNPAYMLREMQGFFGPLGEKGRITSLKPLNPINAPDPWEQSALKRLEHGEREVLEISPVDNQPHLRMMRPFFTEKGCLKCHASQGYKLGDLRGGIDVTIPLAPYLAAANRTNRTLLAGHGGIWLLGVAAILFIARRTTQRERERLTARQALQDSEEKFRQISATAQDAILMMDEEGRLIYWNPAAERIFGYTAEEALGRNMHGLIVPPRFLPSFQQGFAEFKRSGTGPVIGKLTEITALRKNGEEFPVELSISTTHLSGRRVAIGTVRDITERKQGEEALKQLNQELDQRVAEEVAKNREKDHILIQQSRLAAMGEMVHNIAHQWRQPLNALSIILTNIKDDYAYHELTEDKLEKSVSRAHRLLEKMSTTVDDFRDFFRPDREPGEFDISTAIDDALFVMEASLKNNNIAVIKNYSPGLVCYGYANQFSQALLNILANAKDALLGRHVADGAITINLDKVEGKARLAIQDNAGGIPTAVLPRIFEPYFTTKESGSGIGLYMTKMILERNLNGTIEANNHEDGALVTITLPLVQQPS
ncbi:MAG: PAS domain S-box protein [Sulfuricellaceae bacterium]